MNLYKVNCHSKTTYLETFVIASNKEEAEKKALWKMHKFNYPYKHKFEIELIASDKKPGNPKLLIL